VKRGIEAGVVAIVANLKSMSTPVADQTKIAQVAAISAADEDIGRLIAEVMDKVGKDGVITVEESKTLKFETEYVEACSSTAVTSRRTSSPIRSAWRPSWTSPTC